MVTRRDVIKTIGASAILPAISVDTEGNTVSNLVQEGQKARTILVEPARIMYKVVRKDLVAGEMKFYSSNMHKFKLEYKIGEWTEPEIPGSKLFVLKTLKDALNYSGGCHSIFECEIGDVCERAVRRLGMSSVNFYAEADDLAAFWNKKEFNKKGRYYRFLFDDVIPISFEAYLTNKVKLIKEISSF